MQLSLACLRVFCFKVESIGVLFFCHCLQQTSAKSLHIKMYKKESVWLHKARLVYFLFYVFYVRHRCCS